MHSLQLSLSRLMEFSIKLCLRMDLLRSVKYYGQRRTYTHTHSPNSCHQTIAQTPTYLAAPNSDRSDISLRDMRKACRCYNHRTDNKILHGLFIGFDGGKGGVRSKQIGCWFQPGRPQIEPCQRYSINNDIKQRKQQNLTEQTLK